MFALLFGSHAKACQHASSDLDIALFFKQLLYGLDLLYLINELSDYTKKEVDLVVLKFCFRFSKTPGYEALCSTTRTICDCLPQV